MRYNILKINIVFFMLLTTVIILPSTAITTEETNLDYDYYNYQEMTDLLQNLQSQNPDIMKVESYGKTHQGRDIWFVKISDNVDINEHEPGVLLLGAHHGDEKISFEILIYFIKYVMENYETQERVKNAVDTTQIFIMPMINPDGVEANTRKNCNPDPAHGVNTNRNFGYDWEYYNLFPDVYGESEVSQVTSWNYRGPAPNSENETQAIIKLAESFTINISLSYHSGAQVVFYPWYHTTQTTPHENLFIEIGTEMEEISGYPLWTGEDPVIPLPGGTLGTSENYLYGEHKILAYTVESANQKSPTNPTVVNSICSKNTQVHLYLCEKAQTIDNNKDSASKNALIRFPRIFTLIQKILLNLKLKNIE